VWLWLCHEDHVPDGSADQIEKKWHLVGFYNRDKNLHEPKPMICGGLDKGTRVEKLGAFDYCQETNKVLVVDNPGTWSERHESHTYRVLSRDHLEGWCSSFVMVPLPQVDKPEEVGKNGVSVRGAICLNFRDELPLFYNNAGEIWPQLEQTLHWMGRFTAMAIYATHQALQRQILLELNELAGLFLTRSSREAKQARRAYLEHLAKLIRKRLHVSDVSIFYRSPHSHDEVSCLYSTGLYEPGPDGSQRAVLVKEERWSQIRYGLRDGATGRCFSTGRPNNMPVGLLHEPLTWESDQPNKDKGTPYIIYPIPLPPSEPEPAHGIEGRSLGVIRCSEHKSRRFSDKRAFDPYEIETLDFIAQQVGPVLETMSRYADLEQNIAITRHELRSTLGMIHQLAEEMSEGVDPKAARDTQVRSYDIIDIKLSSLLAKSQLQRLFTDGWETRALQISHVKLRGHIVARIASVMSRYAEQERDMRVTFDNASFDQVPPLLVDRYLIEHALINLIMNAIKYGRRGTAVKVAAGADGNRYLITVSNDGPGIAADEKDKIFAAGYRSPRTQDQAEGSGLGLSITKIIMQRHGGDVLLLNLSRPTAFALEFPRGRNQTPPPSA